MHFSNFEKPYDPSFNPLAMIRVGTDFEEGDALEIAANYVGSDEPDRDARLFELASIIRIALRANRAATLDDVQAICTRMNIAWMRDVLRISPN
jgi:hypothetical protein